MAVSKPYTNPNPNDLMSTVAGCPHPCVGCLCQMGPHPYVGCQCQMFPHSYVGYLPPHVCQMHVIHVPDVCQIYVQCVSDVSGVRQMCLN